MEKLDIIFTQDAQINSTKTRGRGTAKNNLLLYITGFKYSVHHVGMSGIHIQSEQKYLLRCETSGACSFLLSLAVFLPA